MIRDADEVVMIAGFVFLWLAVVLLAKSSWLSRFLMASS
jgi:hypothetical protein